MLSACHTNQAPAGRVHANIQLKARIRIVARSLNSSDRTSEPDLGQLYSSRVFSAEACIKNVEVKSWSWPVRILRHTNGFPDTSLPPTGNGVCSQGSAIHSRELSEQELGWLEVLRGYGQSETPIQSPDSCIGGSETTAIQSPASSIDGSETKASLPMGGNRLSLARSLMFPDSIPHDSVPPDSVPRDAAKGVAGASTPAAEESSSTVADTDSATQSKESATNRASQSTQESPGPGGAADANNASTSQADGSQGDATAKGDVGPYQSEENQSSTDAGGLSGEVMALATAPISIAGLELASVSESVSCNSYGEVSEDLAVSELRDQEAEAFNGLWPEFALLNHSCAPNTMHLIVGGVLLLRAARTIPEGEELTTSYLATTRFAPVAERRTALSSQYGFHCNCRRCLIEHHLFPTRRYAPQVEESETLEARYALTAASRDGKQYGGLLQTKVSQLSLGLDSNVQEALTSMGVPEKVRQLSLGLDSDVQEALTSMGVPEKVSQLSLGLDSDVQEALTSMGVPEVRRASVMQQIDAAVATLEASLGQLGLDERSTMFLRASAYPLYRLKAELGELGNVGGLEEQVKAVRMCQQILDAVARGSDTHLFVASKILDTVARGSDTHLFVASKVQARSRAVFGTTSYEARTADLALALGYKVRYGPVDRTTMRALSKARAKLTVGSSMAMRISTMAWDNDTFREREERLG
eukprot:gene26296-17388_t